MQGVFSNANDINLLSLIFLRMSLNSLQVIFMFQSSSYREYDPVGVKC